MGYMLVLYFRPCFSLFSFHGFRFRVCEQAVQEARGNLLAAILPDLPADNNNAILELRAGALEKNYYLCFENLAANIFGFPPAPKLSRILRDSE